MAKQTTMQRRHFELIASTIDGLDISQDDKQKVAKAFVQRLEDTNANFRPVQFYLACGVSWQVGS